VVAAGKTEFASAWKEIFLEKCRISVRRPMDTYFQFQIFSGAEKPLPSVIPSHSSLGVLRDGAAWQPYLKPAPVSFKDTPEDIPLLLKLNRHQLRGDTMLSLKDDFPPTVAGANPPAD
jgi:hypothetical protein